MVLILHVEGATPEALAAGIAAAQAVLNEARVTAAEAALALWAQAEWRRSRSTFARPPEGILAAAAAFRRAESAAIKACCGDGVVPADARLEAADAEAQRRRPG
jgi:hypothetical protein